MREDIPSDPAGTKKIRDYEQFYGNKFNNLR